MKHSEAERRQVIHRVGIVNMAINGLLSVAKLVVGWLANSQALIADGIHSISDLGSDLLVLLAGKHGTKAADEDHPYGHRRIETAGVVVLAVLLFLTAGGIIIDAFSRLITSEGLEIPGLAALAVAVGSILANEFLFQYGRWHARRIHSSLLLANAWHSRGDALSSIVVLLGLVGAQFGLVYLDAVAAIVVGGMILNMAWKMGRDSFQELVDTSIDPDKLTAIENTIELVEGVRDLHQLRARTMGGQVLVDVHVRVHPLITVSEGNHVAENVIDAVQSRFPDVVDVTVHIDAEDDEKEQLTRALPTRSEIMERLRDAWRGVPGADKLEEIKIHYLGGRAHIELSLPLSAVDDYQRALAISRDLKAASRRVEDIGEVTVLFVAP